MQKKYLALALVMSGIFLQLPAMAESFLIQHVRVFDGEKMLQDRNVLIADRKIKDLNFTGKATPDTTIINGNGRTLLPGLIDAHVHVYQDMELPLLFGVTTQIDMANSVDLMKQLNEKMRKGENHDRADVISAGLLATAPGGHGTEYGFPIPTLNKPEEAQAWVDARIAEGSHFIKIVLEHGNEKRPFNSLDVPTVKALIDAAHLRNKLAVVHIGSLKEAEDALDAGADALVHLFTGKQIADSDMRDLVQKAKRRHAFIIPTFSVLESIAGVKEQDVLTDKRLTSMLSKAQLLPLNAPYGREADINRMKVPKMVTAAMHAAGIPILAGTDAGNSGTQYGVSLHHELAALVDAGLSPTSALAAATSVPAHAFGLSDRGRIAKGYKADLVLVAGEPDKDINATRNIVDVWKDGERVSGQREQKMLEVEKQNAQKRLTVQLPPNGRISLFSKEKLASPFGFGWWPSNDAPMGGKSTIDTKLVEPAAGEAGAFPALIINANIQPGFAYPWAGLSFFPGSKPMDAADLSSANLLKFKVKGDGKQYSVGINVQGSYVPISVQFTAPQEWTEIIIPFSLFKGLDASMITIITFSAGPETGAYTFQLADVRLLKE
ncbi:CIA30 family protein [Undibacterium sp. TJN19]|uniref:CIA30 family protein n=1 Tax=Undibacterium sp. TJN19 TaxID=3413055 RepID=UPI003BF39346